METDVRSPLSLLGLSIPLLLTLLRRARWSLVAVGLTTPLTILGLGWVRLVGLGSATGLMAANSILWPTRGIPLLTVGLALGLTASLMADGVPGFPQRYDQWYSIVAAEILGVWGCWRWACDRWGQLLAGGLLLALSGEVLGLYLGERQASLSIAVALVLLMAAIVGRCWGRPQPLALYLVAWSVQLLIAELVGWRGGTHLALAVATLGLGGTTLLVTWLPQVPQRLMPPLRIISLSYGLVVLALRAEDFTAWSGWLTLGIALLGLAISRQQDWPWLRWLAWLALTLGWYELVIYQLFLATGEYLADGLVILAGVAALIMAVYRLAISPLEHYLAWPRQEVLTLAHGHWGLALLLMLLSAAELTRRGLGLVVPGLAVGLGLVIYALGQGRTAQAEPIRSAWVYGGIVVLVGWVAYGRLAMPPLAVVDAWWGAVACGAAVVFYWLPWNAYGWPQQPWRGSAIALPLIITSLTNSLDHGPSLWILAGFYGALAWITRRMRVSYLSAVCIVWGIWIQLETYGIGDDLAFTAPLGLAILYITQVDPAMQWDHNRRRRHILRILGVVLILGVALLSERWTGIPVGLVLGGRNDPSIYETKGLPV